MAPFFVVQNGSSPLPLRTMNIKHYLLAALVVVAVLFPYNNAHAGILDWVGIDKEDIVVDAESPWSLDSFYAFLNTDGRDKDTGIASIVQGSAIMQVTASAKVMTKPVTIKRVLTVEASGYSSTPDQTDDSPFITAKGTYVRDGIIATNILPFGTLVKIPTVYGNKIFVVEDRMNRRYQNHIDIWFPDRETALEFGRRTVRIEII